MSANGILHEPVLLLNVNFEPLHVCNLKRAIALLFAEKAEIVINSRGVIHTSTAEFEVPSVIRLAYMIKRPRPHIALSKREILRRDNFTCQYCGGKSAHLTIDHIIPRHMGGRHTWDNLVAACPPCNRRKGGKRLEQINMSLQRLPKEPSPSATYRFSRYLSQREEWAQFLEGW